MVQFTGREHLQPSLLDRLTDNAPDRLHDPSDQQSLSMIQLRQSVLRDLAWLFSTTRLEALEGMELTPEAKRSVLNYGLPGFAGLTHPAGRVVGLEAAIADAIRIFEPRILPESLRVRLRGVEADSPDGALVFEIHGDLWAQPVPVRIMLETAIDPNTQNVSVTEARNRG
jgi:type VI secretion system protein ImpF